MIRKLLSQHNLHYASLPRVKFDLFIFLKDVFFLAGYLYSFSFSPYFSLGIFFLIGYNVFLISWFDICLLMFIVGFAMEKIFFFLISM